MAPNDTVLVEVADGVARLTLNRPDKLNAFNEEMHRALHAALDEAKWDENVRAILLTGAGRAFCAGQDLAEVDPHKADGEPDLGETIERLYNPLIRLIRSIDKPIVCAVNGVAAGAGASVALACDLVVAGRSARFIQAFCKIGLVPDSGATWALTRLVGEARAKGLALTGRPLDAETAASWGLIWHAVDDQHLMEEAGKLVASLAAGPTVGLGLTKKAIQAASTNGLDDQLDLERDLQREAGLTPDYAEGVAAFTEKRPANFTGRR